MYIVQLCAQYVRLNGHCQRKIIFFIVRTTNLGECQTSSITKEMKLMESSIYLPCNSTFFPSTLFSFFLCNLPTKIKLVMIIFV